MPFRSILQEMISNTSGAIAAVFLDYEGETVAFLSETLSRDDVRIIGAYQGIFLSQLRNLCFRTEGGSIIQRFKLDFPGGKIMSVDMQDGYFIVLVTNHDSNEGLAWKHLDVCRERLITELA